MYKIQNKTNRKGNVSRKIGTADYIIESCYKIIEDKWNDKSCNIHLKLTNINKNMKMSE